MSVVVPLPPRRPRMPQPADELRRGRRGPGAGRIWVLACGACFAVAAFRGWAADPLLIQSQSGQFQVQGLAGGQPLIGPASTAHPEFVRLIPAVLTVSLERIKHALLTELGLADHWRGTVFVHLRPVQQDLEAIRVTSIRFRDGWNYRLELPELAHKDRFLRAVVQVLLMELANRPGAGRAAELPPWLGEGLLAHLRATALAGLTLEPKTSTIARGQRREPLLGPRECLRTNTPLTLDELNLPTPEQLAGSHALVYQNCAHLFVAELLALREGRACLREMLAQLHRYRNWQTAFLSAFTPYFQGLLEVDKWWALNVVELTGKDPFSLWPQTESWARLDDVLKVTVDVRVQPDELPAATEVGLSKFLAQTDLAQHLPVLRQKLLNLHALRPRVMPAVAAFVDDYYTVLLGYVRGQTEKAKTKNSRVADAVRRLDELDAHRAALRESLHAAQARPRPSAP